MSNGAESLFLGIDMSAVYASTTRSWFEHLSRLLPKRAAFWQPTPARPAQIAVGERWYFKELGAPQLLGYGEFFGWERLSVRELFARYGSASGYDSERELIAAFRAFNPALGSDSEIGNVVLESFTPFPTPVPLRAVGLEDLSVRFVYLGEQDPIAEYIGGLRGGAAGGGFVLRDEAAARHTAAMRKHRAGQAAFRKLLLDTYGPVCAFTGPQLEETLQAAHIQPYVDAASNHVANGLLLRADIHVLFDLGLLTLTDEPQIVVSRKLLGRNPTIDALHGATPHLRNTHGVSPSGDALRFHGRFVFQT